MTRNYLTGFDVDTDGVAEALRRLADGIEDDGVAIRAASTESHIRDADDTVEFGVDMKYHASHDFADVVDLLRFATRQYIRFESEYIADILNGDKTTTVRYQLSREFEPGDTIDLIDPDDDTFATATVEAYIDLSIRRVCDFGIGSWEPDEVDDLVALLSDLYETDEIDEDSYVTVILFSGVEANGDYVEDSLGMSPDEFFEAMDETNKN